MSNNEARLGRGVGLIALMMSLVWLLTGCGGSAGAADSGAAPSVASVADPQAGSDPATSGAPPAADARPLVRPDQTSEEAMQLSVNYWKCLTDHGVPEGDEKLANEGKPEYKAARLACAAQEPEDLTERLRRTDPQEYEDRARKFHVCMRAKGVKTVPIEGKDDPMQYRYPPGLSMETMSEAAIACRKKAFASALK